MKVVVELSKEELESYKNLLRLGLGNTAMRKIINGIPLPKENDVLDKIRAEIEQLRLHKAQFVTNDNKVCIDSQEVLNVIDKYKAESEDK